MNIIHRIEKWVDRCIAYVPRQRPLKKESSNASLIAHRGAHDDALSIKENTLAAFDRALNLGCQGIEFDVHATADHVLVVNHDPTLKRLWGHDVAINQLSFEALRTLAPALPSLTEVVERYSKRMHLFIELKAPFKNSNELANILQRLAPCVDYHLLCLNEAVFTTLALFPKESLLLVPTFNNVNKFCKLSLQHCYGGILGHYLLLGHRQIKQMQTAKQLVGVGFVDSKFSLYRELNRGIPLLFTNNAAIMADCLKKLRE